MPVGCDSPAGAADGGDRDAMSGVGAPTSDGSLMSAAGLLRGLPASKPSGRRGGSGTSPPIPGGLGGGSASVSKPAGRRGGNGTGSPRPAGRDGGRMPAVRLDGPGDG